MVAFCRRPECRRAPTRSRRRRLERGTHRPSKPVGLAGPCFTERRGILEPGYADAGRSDADSGRDPPTDADARPHAEAHPEAADAGAHATTHPHADRTAAHPDAGTAHADTGPTNTHAGPADPDSRPADADADRSSLSELLRGSPERDRRGAAAILPAVR